jgi:LuxR family maltose regulon positive regulatory protein
MLSLPAMLVPTKLMMPQLRSTLVPRTRLLAQLDAHPAARLIMVIAPAGFGKSTLVAQWLIAANRRSPTTAAAWLTLDEHDQDGLRFLNYLAGAICYQLPDALPLTRPLLAAREPPPLYVIMQALLIDLSALDDTLTLVLDDYHLIKSDAIHQALTYLLRHLPPQCQIVLISRVDPPLPQVRLRAEGALLEVRASELRFNREETSELFARLHPQHVEEALVTRVYQQTEGWAIALQLAALANQQSTRGTALALASRQIAEYLAAEVLAQQTSTVQEHLVTLAIPERFCAELAVALLAEPDQRQAAEYQIEQQIRSNQLLLPLDGDGRWYRFHHLFRDLLLRQLRLNKSDSAINALQMRAATWFAEAGHVEEALRLFLAADAEDDAAALVEQHVVRDIQHGAVNSSIGSWLRFLPAELIERRPGLTLVAARLASLSLDLGSVQSHLTRIDTLLDVPTRALPWPQFAADRAALTGIMLFWQGNAEAAFAHLQYAVNHSTAIMPMGQIFLYFGLAFVGNDQYAEGHARLMLTLPDVGEALDVVTSRYYRYTSLCGMHLMAGKLHALARDAHALADHIAAAGLGTATATYAAYCLGLAAYERSDLVEAAAQFSVLTQLKYQVNATTYIAGLVGITLTLLAQGAYGEAASYVAEANHFADESGGAFLRNQALACSARLAFAQGDKAAAMQAAIAITPDIHLGSSPWVETPRLTQARIFIASSEPTMLSAAETILDGCMAEIDALHHTRLRIAALTIRALLYQQQGRRDAALTLLEQTLQQAAPHEFVRSFVDAGQPLQPLLYAFRERHSCADYVQRLLLTYRPTDVLPPLPALFSPLPEMLTRREREILALLAERWSNREIAERLVVTVNTVRKHTSTIYDKLGVNSRREAVASARALGLLPAS